MGPVLVLGDGSKEPVTRAIDDLRTRLERDFGVVAIDLDGSMDLRGVEAGWVLLLGGDGAIMSANHRMGSRPLPLLAVNFGRLGFLTEVEYKQLDAALDGIRDGRAKLRQRMRLTATVGDWQHDALNDVVVTGIRPGRVFHVSARIGGHEALSYAGDGVVIATPTGSTAYSLAAGGPILAPELHATVITPLCAHALSHRPLVVPSTDRIDLYLRQGDPRGRVVVDGQVMREIGVDDRLGVKESKTPFVFIRVGLRSHYRRLKRMLGWGGRPKYSSPANPG